MTQPSPGPALARAPLVLAIYAVTAAILAASWWRGLVPFPFLGGDAGNIASFAAGWSHPGAWTGDMVLANHDNFRFYATIHIPLLIALAPLTGDLGTAFVVLLAPLMWIQALGHWLLGRLLFRHADGAFLLGLLSFGSVSMTLDYYGTYPDAQPRFLFQAALPFLLAGLVKAAESPGRWPRLMGLHGLAVYLHPVSAPSVALASWLTLLLRGPRGRPVMAGLAFVLPALPFAAMYLSGHEHGPTADYAAALARQSLLFGPEFTDGWAYLRRVLTTWQMRWFVPVWGFGGAVLVWYLAPTQRPRLVLLTVWMSMVVVASLGVTLAEQAVTRHLRMMPVEIDTIRNLRYAVPVLMLFGLWGAVEAARRLPYRFARLVPVLCAAVWLGANKPGVMPVRDTASCLASGHLLCPPAEWGERRAMLDFLRGDLAPGTTVLPALDRQEGTDAALAIRYYTLRPVVFCFKDGGTSLGYANHAVLERWLSLAGRLDAAHRAADWPALAALADELAANIVVLDIPVIASDGWTVLYQAGRYSVLGRRPTR